MIYGIFLLVIAFVFWFAIRMSKSVPLPPDAVSDGDIEALVRNGERLKAIKWYRIKHQASLRAAKRAIGDMT
jgi:hypothetical protein